VNVIRPGIAEESPAENVFRIFSKDGIRHSFGRTIEVKVKKRSPSEQNLEFRLTLRKILLKIVSKELLCLQ